MVGLGETRFYWPCHWLSCHRAPSASDVQRREWNLSGITFRDIAFRDITIRDIDSRFCR
jgi:hypothetical protein